MQEELREGVPIAHLIGSDGSSIIGWVYRWNTGALAIRWAPQGPQRVSRLSPDLDLADKAEIDFASLTQLPDVTGG